MPGSPKIGLLACVCTLALALAGCGSDDEGGTIPSTDSENLISLLDAVEDNVAGGNCELAQKQAEEFVDAVNALPAEVGEEVKSGLRDGGSQLAELSADPSECEDTTGDSGLGGVEPEPEPEPETTTTTEETTTEESTTTTDTEDDSEEPPPPPDDDQGDSGGGGEGGGGSGGGEGTVTIEPPADDDPTSGGIGGDKGKRP
jgi:hypothetical protein